MKRALKRWWVYLAAVPLADGKSAFRLGRSNDVAATVVQVNESSPLPAARIWALEVVDNRSARRAESILMGEFEPYRSHRQWFIFQTVDAAHKESVHRGMQLAAEWAACGKLDSKGWIGFRIPKPMKTQSR